jgi:hypothetical protein
VIGKTHEIAYPKIATIESQNSPLITVIAPILADSFLPAVLHAHLRIAFYF